MIDKKKSVHFIGSAAGPRRFGAEEITLEFNLDGAASDAAGRPGFTPLTEEGFPGTAELEEEPPLPEGLDPAVFSTGGLPILQVEVTDDGEHGVYFTPLLADDGEHGLVVGISTGPDPQWPKEYNAAGVPALLNLDPLVEDLGEPAPISLEPLELQLVLVDQSPVDPDGFIYGDLLYLNYGWQLLANAPMQYLGEWQFEVDRSTSAELLFPVEVRDSDAGPGESAPADRGGDGGSNENWNFMLPVPIQGKLIGPDGEEQPFDLILEEDGTAESLVDIGGIPVGSSVDAELPAELTVVLHGGSAVSEDPEPLPDTHPEEHVTLQLTSDSVSMTRAARASEIDCDAARAEVAAAEQNACNCDAEEAAAQAAVSAFWDAKGAQTIAEQELIEAQDALPAAEQAAEEAEEAAEDAEDAVQAARQALADYINDSVPGCSAKVGTAAEAGSYASPSQHGAGFACGSDFVGARVDDQSSWDSHWSQINDMYNAWKDAYHAAKAAKAKAQAAKAAADQAKADVQAAQDALDAANQALQAAKAALDSAQQALAGCRAMCAAAQQRLREARQKAELCRIREEHERRRAEEEGGTSPSSEGGGGDVFTPGAAGGTTTPGGAEGGAGEGAGPGSGDSGGEGDSGGDDDDDGEDVRPPNGWPWEQPPPSGSTGDEKLDELRRLLAKLGELIDKWNKVKKELEENPLVEEVRLYESIGDLLDNIGDLDEDVANALKEFAKCNSQPLADLLAKGGDKIDSVIAALTLMKGMISLYIIADSDMPAGRKATLEGIRDKLNTAIEKLEELKDKADNAAELAETLAAIKRGDIWPEDIAEWLAGKIEDMLGEAAEELAKKLVEKALVKILGSKAVPILGILIDLVNFGDALGKKFELDDIDEAINKVLKEAIAKANTMAEYKIDCDHTWIGRHVWIAGSEKDWENTEVDIKWVKTCWCADKEEWVSMDCPAGEARVEQKGGRRFFYFDKITLPKTDCNPCYITVEITIKRGNTSVTHSLLVGVQVCK